MYVDLINGGQMRSDYDDDAGSRTPFNYSLLPARPMWLTVSSRRVGAATQVVPRRAWKALLSPSRQSAVRVCLWFVSSVPMHHSLNAWGPYICHIHSNRRSCPNRCSPPFIIKLLAHKNKWNQWLFHQKCMYLRSDFEPIIIYTNFMSGSRSIRYY